MDVSGGARIMTLGVVVEQTGADTAKAEILSLGPAAEQSAARVKAAFQANAAAMQQIARNSAQGFATQFTTQFESDSLRIREGVARGLLSPQDARKAGQDAAREFNRGVVSQLDQLGSAGLNVGNSKTYRELAGSLKGVEEAAVRSAVNINSVRAAATSMAASAVSAAPGVTQLGSVLGTFAIGAPMMVGILAGVAALTYEYQYLTKGTREAREEQEKLNKVRDDYLAKIGRPAGDLGKSGTASSESAAAIGKQRNQVEEEYSALIARQQKGEEGLGLAIGQKYAKLQETNKAYFDASNAAKLLGNEIARLTNASKEAATQAALEVEHQRALNAAYGQSSLVIAKINADYQLRAALLSNAAQYVGNERKEMDAAARAMHDASIAAAENAAGTAEMRSKIAELNAALPDLQKNFDALAPSLMYVDKLWQDQLHNVQQLKDSHTELEKQVIAIGKTNETVATAQLKETADNIKKQQDYANDMTRIWRDGFARIAADGSRSFADMIEDIFRMFSRLLDRIEQEGKGSVLDGLKSLWNKKLDVSGGIQAGVGGALAGYNSGSAGGGLLSGAAAGFAVGGPAGAAIGALAGLTGGLLGGAKAARERREAEEQLRKSYELSIASIKHQLGDISDVDFAKAQAATDADAMRKQAIDLYGGDSVLEKYFGKQNRLPAALAQIDELQKRRAAQIEEEARLQQQQYTEDLHVRLLRAQGNDKAADAMALQLQQERERQALIQSFGTVIDPTEAATLALLDQVQAQEKLAASSNKVASGFLNIEDGLRVMADRFNAITPYRSFTTSGLGPTLTPPAPPPVSSASTSSQSSDGSPATFVLQVDGRELGRIVVKNLERKSSRTSGSTTDWSKVSAN